MHCLVGGGTRDVGFWIGNFKCSVSSDGEPLATVYCEFKKGFLGLFVVEGIHACFEFAFAGKTIGMVFAWGGAIECNKPVAVMLPKVEEAVGGTR